MKVELIEKTGLQNKDIKIPDIQKLLSEDLLTARSE
jgi:hypothetical protein